MQVTVQDIFQAYHNIRKDLVHTPLIHSRQLSQRAGADVWLKMENRQRTGSFKTRGALNKIRSLNPEDRAKGVITASAGNHGQGVALAAQMMDISTLIVVPENTPRTKIAGIRGLGAELVTHGATYDEAEAHAFQLAELTGRTYIHAYQDPDIIAGQGTVGLEMLLDAPDVDVILVPSGGGGLICGIAIAAKAINPDIRVIGVQSEASPPWYYSFQAKRMVDVTYRDSLAEGLHGGIGEENLQLALRYVDDFILVTEEAIAEAMAWMAACHQEMIEGSAAVGIAVLLHQQLDVAGKKVVPVVTGGNVDSHRLAELVMAREKQNG